ncbi:hypothetical protein T11_3700 [Trichinella zimbabwensis]|uniref:Uncharacterized protein n=1 Tax=Trichinella zimbabwensis TaxID=268475 RepID=A0A0V1I2C6_9BILA|nr:hypothetical protein T11_3700 [Trichinella zimbabwensis]
MQNENNISGCFMKKPNYRDLKHEPSIVITFVENNAIPCANWNAFPICKAFRGYLKQLQAVVIATANKSEIER